MPSSSRSNVQARRWHPRKHTLVWAWIVGSCVAALIATYVMFVEPPPPRRIVIASGSTNGAYYRFARKYAEELRKTGISVEVRETAGSVENLALLGQDGSGVGLAILQSGVASASDIEKFYALGSLYHEPLWVFYRSDAPVERLSQLAGKHLGVGPNGSGTHAIAIKLLALNGLIDSESGGANSQRGDRRGRCRQRGESLDQR